MHQCSYVIVHSSFLGTGPKTKEAALSFSESCGFGTEKFEIRVVGSSLEELHLRSRLGFACTFPLMDGQHKQLGAYTEGLAV